MTLAWCSEEWAFKQVISVCGRKQFGEKTALCPWLRVRRSVCHLGKSGIVREGFNSYICLAYITNVSVVLWHGVRLTNLKVGGQPPELAHGQLFFLRVFLLWKMEEVKENKKFIPP